MNPKSKNKNQFKTQVCEPEAGEVSAGAGKCSRDEDLDFEAERGLQRRGHHQTKFSLYSQGNTTMLARLQAYNIHKDKLD
jgi:hypothetical protein